MTGVLEPSEEIKVRKKNQFIVPTRPRQQCLWPNHVRFTGRHSIPWSVLLALANSSLNAVACKFKDKSYHFQFHDKFRITLSKHF